MGEAPDAHRRFLVPFRGQRFGNLSQGRRCNRGWKKCAGCWRELGDKALLQVDSSCEPGSALWDPVELPHGRIGVHVCKGIAYGAKAKVDKQGEPALTRPPRKVNPA